MKKILLLITCVLPLLTWADTQPDSAKKASALKAAGASAIAVFVNFCMGEAYSCWFCY